MLSADGLRHPYLRSLPTCLDHGLQNDLNSMATLEPRRLRNCLLLGMRFSQILELKRRGNDVGIPFQPAFLIPLMRALGIQMAQRLGRIVEALEGGLEFAVPNREVEGQRVMVLIRPDRNPPSFINLL